MTIANVHCCKFIEQIYQWFEYKKEQLVVPFIVSYKIVIEVVGWKEQ